MQTSYFARGLAFAALGLAIAISSSCGGSAETTGSGGSGAGSSTKSSGAGHPTGSTGAGNGGTMTTSSNKCSACGKGKQCDHALGCVECLKSGDCTDPARPVCFEGSCEECGATSDCAVNKTCSPVDHTCGLPCKADADCKNGDAAKCDTARGVCVNCFDVSDCPNNPICDKKAGQCVDCQTDTDCSAAAPACDSPLGKCVECNFDGQCRSGYVCAANACIKSCTKNADCGHGQPPACAVDIAQCVACVANADCTNPNAPSCTADHQCVQCATNADCTQPATPVCTNYNQCVECVTNMDCNANPNGFLCGGGSRCVQCLTDADCPGGTCVNSACM